MVVGILGNWNNHYRNRFVDIGKGLQADIKLDIDSLCHSTFLCPSLDLIKEAIGMQGCSELLIFSRNLVFARFRYN